MDFSFFNVESIYEFTSTFVAICFAISYPIVFPSISKFPHLDIIKCFVTTLSNKDNKISFIRVNEDIALAISYEFIQTCHNMNIVVQTTGGDAYSLNGKIEIPNNNIDTITRALLMK